MSKDILYKPDLDYEKSYYTEGHDSSIIVDEDLNIDDSSDNLIDKLDNIKDIIQNIKDKLPFIPKDVLEVFIPSFIIVNDTVEDLIDNEEYIPKEPEIEYPEIIPLPGDDDEDEGKEKFPDAPSDPFGKGDDIYIDIKIPLVDVGEEIEREYINDLTDIIGDYVSNYNDVLNKYVTNAVTFMYDSKYSSLKIVKTKDLKDKNLSHVSDYLVKSKITLRQQLNLYKKMYDTEETMFQIRATKVAKEQLKRYKQNKRIEDINSVTKGANDLLKESIIVSEKKYEENFYSLYKYLNSSVILLDECMNTVIKQKQSLILLNNNEREK